MYTIRRGIESFILDEIIEEHMLEGRKISVTWRGSAFSPPRDLIRQASGICITDEGLIVLVTGDGESWGLPGGHPENDETINQIHVHIFIVSICRCAGVGNGVCAGIRFLW